MTFQEQIIKKLNIIKMKFNNKVENIINEISNIKKVEISNIHIINNELNVKIIEIQKPHYFEIKKIELVCCVCYGEFINNEINIIDKCNCKADVCDVCLKLLVKSQKYKCVFCRRVNKTEVFEDMIIDDNF